MPADDPLYRGQTDSRPLEVLRAMQPLKDAEQLVGVLHIEAGSVVANKVDGTLVRLAILRRCADFDPRRIALPRVRDFRGLSGKSFDGRGNLALGLKEQIVFPEIDYDKVDAVRGMDIVICTTAKTDAEAKALLRGFNMPFVN